MPRTNRRILPCKARRLRRGFALVELLVVIAVIAVLAGLIMATLGGFFERQKVTVALTDIEQIRIALDAYEQAWGYYPPTDRFDGSISHDGPNASMVECMAFEDKELDFNDPHRGPFIKDYLLRDSSRFETRRIDGQDVLLWLDPWQNPYIYFNRNTIRQYNGDDGPRYRISGSAAQDAGGTLVWPRKDESGVFFDATRFQVWSCGKDKQTGKEGNESISQDDITSWGDGAGR